MRLLHLCISVLLLAGPAVAQFEFPVQLIGFPVIIIAVRIANFIKKLSYALNPKTYRSRNKRGLPPTLDIVEVEKKLVSEMGEKVCIYEEVCLQYATQSLQPEADLHLDWEEIFRKFATSPKDKGEFYLLSIFLGDIVGSPDLCRQLAKRGRSCGSSVPYVDPLTSAARPYMDPLTSTARPYLDSSPLPSSSPSYFQHPIARSTPRPFFLPMDPQLGFSPQR